jgi:hypothetical protein
VNFRVSWCFKLISSEFMKTSFELMKSHQDLNYASSWGWFLKPRAQAKEKKLLENFHAVTLQNVIFFDLAGTDASRVVLAGRFPPT